MQPYIAVLAELIKNNAKVKPSQLRKLVSQWAEDNRGDTALSDILIQPQLQAEMAGQLMVDVHETKKVTLGRIVLQDELPAFLSLRWDDAIVTYNNMDIPRAREFRRVIEEYGGRSKKARELLLRAIKERSLELINQALEEGSDLRAYMQDIEQFANDLGVSVNNPAYLQNVFRTNLQTAYSAGRWRAMNDPDVVEAIPHWQYRSTNDARTCDFCRYMDGRIFEKGNSATDFLVPPCHYQSRSQAVSYEPGQGERVEKKPPSGFANKTGYIADFGHNPTELLKLS